VSYEVSDEDDIRCCIAYNADKIKYKDEKYQKHGYGPNVSVFEDAWRDHEIDKETEEEVIKVEEDFTTNSNMVHNPQQACFSRPSLTSLLCIFSSSSTNNITFLSLPFIQG